jgi:alkaline phosphatase isozyme conversion protein
MKNQDMKRKPIYLCLLALCLLILPACQFLTGTDSGPDTARVTATSTFAVSPTQASPSNSEPTATLAEAPGETAEPAATLSEFSGELPTPSTEWDMGQIARRHMEALSTTVGPRPSGSAQEAQAAAYIQAVFVQSGYEVQVQPFTFQTYNGDRLSSANLVILKPGISTQEIIVGAHYDSGDEGLGADDNASGVGVLLELALMIRDLQTPYTIRLIAFGAEENDLDGSRYFVNQMTRSEFENTVGMFNLDSVSAGDTLYVYGDAGPGSMRDWILERADYLGFDVDTREAAELDNEDGTPCECADYGPFQEAGIPFAYFEATDWTMGDQDGWTQVDPQYGDNGQIWHTQYDTLDYIDSTFPGRVDQHLGQVVMLMYEMLTQYAR